MSFLANFLTKNNLPFTEAPNGILYHIEQAGSGANPQAGDYVKVHYRGSFLDGKVFDSSMEGRDPLAFQLGQGYVIKGWDEGIPLFPVGSKGKLYLSPEFGYGAAGQGDAIPPNATLVFDVEVIEVMDEAAYKAYEAAQEEERRKLIQQYLEKQLEMELPNIRKYVEAQPADYAYTLSGLHYHMEQEGEGPTAQPGQTVWVHYTGSLLNGQEFDSSRNRGQAFSFKLGENRVIPGWEEGLALFKKGGKGKLVIPSILGYGPRDMGVIPPNSILLFDIELLDVQ
ncbi:MAG: FKBP-type peptidyl-prolyl cis-trans isomerase [Bacteroidota bacterium]